MAKAKKVEEVESKPLKRVIWMKLERVTPGAVRYAEVTASGTKKKAANAHFRTMYIRHEALPKDSDGELVAPSRLKVTVSEE